jgi:hypothetical protein
MELALDARTGYYSAGKETKFNAAGTFVTL